MGAVKTIRLGETKPPGPRWAPGGGASALETARGYLTGRASI